MDLNGIEMTPRRGYFTRGKAKEKMIRKKEHEGIQDRWKGKGYSRNDTALHV